MERHKREKKEKIIQHFSADMRAFDITKMVVLCMKFSSTQFFFSSLLLPLLTYEPDNTSLCLIPKQNLPKRAQLKLSNFCFIGSCFVKCTLASIRKGGMKSLWENQVAQENRDGVRELGRLQPPQNHPDQSMQGEQTRV